MFRKYKILMSPEKCTYYSGIFNEKSYLNSKKSYEFNLNGLRKNSRIHIVVEGKEVFIEEISFRRPKKSQIPKLVEYALIERFHCLNEIAFDFKVMKRDKFETLVIIFCLNIGNLPLSNEGIFKGIKIKSVEIIQQLYAKKLRKLIKCKSFEGLIINQDFLYYLKVYKGVLVENKVVPLDLLYEDEELIDLCKEANAEGRIIYIYCEGNEEALNTYLSPYENIEIYSIKRKIKERKHSSIGVTQVKG